MFLQKPRHENKNDGQFVPLRCRNAPSQCLRTYGQRSLTAGWEIYAKIKVALAHPNLNRLPDNYLQ
ncbi:hypothetical protein EO95_07295 [Methanosarcina sp. 1.H.T.1A.1]|nr:hypothetical protein EO95_07295 [Methanosarcina sp. 1.H.T.1A.1]